jgi:hypothetical protein
VKAWSFARSLILILLVAVSGSVVLTRTTPSPAGAGSAGVTLRFALPDSTVAPGETFEVDIVLDKGQFERGISAVSIRIGFDPRVLRAASLEPATVFLPAQEYVPATGGGTTSLVIGARSCEEAERVPEQMTIARIAFEAVGDEGSSTRIDWLDATAMSPVACGIADLQQQDWEGVSENVVREARGAKVCVANSQDACTPPPTVPNLLLAPDSGPRGQTVEATVSGFQPNERVELIWDRGKPKHKGGGKGNKRGHGKNDNGKKKRFAQVGLGNASQEGAAVITFTVERQARTGLRPVEAVGSVGSRASGSFHVTAGTRR